VCKHTDRQTLKINLFISTSSLRSPWQRKLATDQIINLRSDCWYTVRLDQVMNATKAELWQWHA